MDYITRKRREYQQKRRKQLEARNTQENRADSICALSSFAVYVGTFEKHLSAFDSHEISGAFAEFSDACFDLYMDDVDTTSADEDLISRVCQISEELVRRHGSAAHEKVDWDAYKNICCAFPEATNIWRLYPENFDLEKEYGPPEDIIAMTPDHIALRPEMSRSGNHYIGVLKGESPSIAQRQDLIFMIDYFKGTKEDILREVDTMRQDDARARIEEDWEEGEIGMGEAVNLNRLNNFFYEAWRAFFVHDGEKNAGNDDIRPLLS